MFVAAPTERLPKYLTSSIHILSILRRLNVQLRFKIQVANTEIKIDTVRVGISGVENIYTPRYSIPASMLKPIAPINANLTSDKVSGL